MTTNFFSYKNRKIAYSFSKNSPNRDDLLIVFLGGFMSDMNGTKANFLFNYCKNNKHDFLKFDYSGHGSSEGNFNDFCISDWKEESLEIIKFFSKGSVIIIGSSMGGWIALIIANILSEINGIICIAAAPDFTEDKIFKDLSIEEKELLFSKGFIEKPSNFSDSPYIFTKKLIDDGRKNLIMNKSLNFNFCVRLLQGTADNEVDLSTALKLLKKINCNDINLTLVKNANHQFSDNRCLNLIEEKLSEIIKIS